MTLWPTVHLTQARQVGALMGVAEADLPPPEVPVRGHYEALRAADTDAALDFIAHALPRHEAIYWAAALLPASAGHASAGQDDLRDAIRDWLAAPDDAGRRKAYALAQRLDRTVPERTLAAALFYSGGSIAPPDVAPVLPVPGLANRLAATAVVQAAYRSSDAHAFVARALREAEALAKQGLDRRVSA